MFRSCRYATGTEGYKHRQILGQFSIAVLGARAKLTTRRENAASLWSTSKKWKNLPNRTSGARLMKRETSKYCQHNTRRQVGENMRHLSIADVGVIKSSRVFRNVCKEHKNVDESGSLVLEYILRSMYARRVLRSLTACLPRLASLLP